MRSTAAVGVRKDSFQPSLGHLRARWLSGLMPQRNVAKRTQTDRSDPTR
jgi:hypothetical protein